MNRFTFQSIDEQKKRCDQVLSSKDKIIKDYRQALKDSSEDFKKALVAQGEDIGSSFFFFFFP